jgi:hypothetical protein
MRNRGSSRISSRRNLPLEPDRLLLERLALEDELIRRRGRHGADCACWTCVIALHRWVAKTVMHSHSVRKVILATRESRF